MEPSLTPIPPETKTPFAPWVRLPLLSGIGALAALVAASLLFPGWLVLQEACLVGFALVVGQMTRGPSLCHDSFIREIAR